jgi:threonine/homoserine/homoserine lactone efflux protein
VLGNVLGEFVLTAVVAVGLGPILQRFHPLYLGIQWFGAGYLVYLGVDAVRKRRAHADSMTDVSAGQPALLTTVKQGFVVGVLNPKSLVFFAAILPEFADHSRGHFTEQLLLMGATFCLLALFFDGVWGFVAGSIRDWLSSDVKKLERLRLGGGVVMVGLGIFTFINSLLHH